MAGAFVTAEGEVGDGGSGRHSFCFSSSFCTVLPCWVPLCFSFWLFTSVKVCFCFRWMGEWEGERERCGGVMGGVD